MKLVFILLYFFSFNLANADDSLTTEAIIQAYNYENDTGENVVDGVAPFSSSSVILRWDGQELKYDPFSSSSVILRWDGQELEDPLGLF